MKKTAIVFAAAAMMLAGACTSKETEKTVPQEAEQAQPATEVVATQGDGKVVELTDAKQYAPGVKVSQLTILDFNAVWCGPCRQLAPVFDELAGKYAGRVTFVSVDVDKFGELFESYKLGQSIPAVLFIYPDGHTAKYVGTGDLLPASKFEALIDAALAE